MIKAQVLADFISQITLSEDENVQDTSTLRTIHTDGSSVQKMGGVGVILTSPKGDILKYNVQL